MDYNRIPVLFRFPPVYSFDYAFLSDYFGIDNGAVLDYDLGAVL
jgi:hypothetical protein